MKEDPGMEGRKTEEELIQEAADTIYKNLFESGLAKEIVERSAHAVQPFQSDVYNGVYFEYQNATGGVGVRPLLGRNSSNPVTLKIYRLYPDRAQQIEASNKLWEGVGEDQKKALINAAISYRTITNQAAVESARRAKEESGDESMSMSGQVSTKALEILRKLRLALESNSVEMEILPSDGTLGAFLDE